MCRVSQVPLKSPNSAGRNAALGTKSVRSKDNFDFSAAGVPGEHTTALRRRSPSEHCILHSTARQSLDTNSMWPARARAGAVELALSPFRPSTSCPTAYIVVALPVLNLPLCRPQRFQHTERQAAAVPPSTPRGEVPSPAVLQPSPGQSLDPPQYSCWCAPGHRSHCG